jgi:hypothetical protein
MSAEFSIDVDPSRDLVRIAMSGFFTHDDIRAFYEARAEAHKQLRCGPNQHLTINDLRGMKVQSADVVAAFQKMLADSAYHSRRLAFVVTPTLARSQLMRAAAGRRPRCFASMLLAEAWIFSSLDRDSAVA